jgi:simple sugar transport system ATP-binding protein
VLIGRELAFGPRVLVCHEPTAGLDAATAETMLQHLRDAARTGAGVLLISSDLDELMHTCDRIAVLFRGRIIRVLTRGEFQAGRIGRMMVTGQDPGA